jgi:signal peptidase I
MVKSKSSAGNKSKSGGKSDPPADEQKHADGGWRETVESIAMAVILALLFRGFVAEAFVIPTGSMAPTLRGRHKDVQCPECKLWYQIGASDEVPRDGGSQESEVIAGTCPSCRYTQPINPYYRLNDGSFSGDRIIVSKFLYDFAQPKRWDVIVFKFPGDATQNYIKRLVGLPGETIRIQGGNIWVRQPGQEDFQIARKPPDMLNVLLQLVSDSEHVSERVLEAGWPLEWFEGEPHRPPASPRWRVARTGPHSVAFESKGDAQEHWLRYRRIVPTAEEWTNYLLAEPPGVPDVVDGIEGELITDFYDYNTAQLGPPGRGGTLEIIQQTPLRPAPGKGSSPYGEHWVDDLAVECLAQVKGNSGQLLLDLVRAGIHHRASIDVASGKATLTRIGIDGRRLPFEADGKSATEVHAQTAVRGPGKYRLGLSNCDHEVLLWVNGRVVEFDGPTTYRSAPLVMPISTPADYGDLQPAGIGSRGLAVGLSQLRIYRDKYYIAHRNHDYSAEPKYGQGFDAFVKTPGAWRGSPFFTNRGYVDFELGPDHYFPLGDNSPASQDARTWPTGSKIEAPNYVRRDLLIGKAMFVYWPHTWNSPIPFLPNPTQMRPIR